MVGLNKKIKYRDLSWPLKIGIVGGIIYIIFLMLNIIFIPFA